MTTRLGVGIREYRKVLGWDQRSLAQRVALSPQYVCDIELRHRAPPPSVVVNFAVVMDVDSTILMWLWLADQVGDEMADAMRGVTCAAAAPAPGTDSEAG